MFRNFSGSKRGEDIGSDSSASSHEQEQAANNVTITVDSPSKYNRIAGDGPVIVPSNLGSDENLLASDALNEETQLESHFKNNLQLEVAATVNSPSSIIEAGLGNRNSLQVPFSLGRSSKDADSICTAQSHIMSGEKFDPSVEWYSDTRTSA